MKAIVQGAIFLALASTSAINCHAATQSSSEQAATVLLKDPAVLLKDSAGRIINSEVVSELMEIVKRGDGRFTVKLNIGIDYDPFKMGESPEYESTILKKVENTERELIEEIGRTGLENNIKIFHKLHPIPWLIVDVDAHGLNGLLDSKLVQIVAEPVSMTPFLNETLPLIQAPTLHATGAAGSGKAVAIIDTGIQTSHPMFAGKVISQACFVTKNSPGDEGCSFSYGSTSTGAGELCTSHPNCTHGTHVGGIAVGAPKTALGYSISGIAYSASLISIRTASVTYSGGTPTGVNFRTDDGVAALNYLYTNRFALNLASVNISWGVLGTFTADAYCDSFGGGSMRDAIDLLTGAGIPVVAASGTSTIFSTPAYAGKIAFPACVEKAVAVTSVSKLERQETATSANSAIVDLLAPGGAAPLTPSSTLNILSSLTSSTYGYMGGTSMAAPHVAGAIAALRSGPWSSGAITVNQMIDHLKTTGSTVSLNIDGTPTTYSHKLIKLGNAIITPSTPAALTVTPFLCYGQNEVAWPASSGTVTHYEMEGSSSATYSSPYSISASPYGMVDVSGTTYLRVRACHGPSCSGWRNGNRTATYTSGCV